jgi:hypothetical protein
MTCGEIGQRDGGIGIGAQPPQVGAEEYSVCGTLSSCSRTERARAKATMWSREDTASTAIG